MSTISRIASYVVQHTVTSAEGTAGSAAIGVPVNESHMIAVIPVVRRGDDVMFNPVATTWSGANEVTIADGTEGTENYAVTAADIITLLFVER